MRRLPAKHRNRLRVSLSILCAAATSGCIIDPVDQLEVEKTDQLNVAGYAGQPGQAVEVFLRDYDQGQLVSVGVAHASQSEAFANSGLYGWSLQVDSSSSTYWGPSDVGFSSTPGDIPGRLELRAQIGGADLATFTQAGIQCLQDELGDGATHKNAGSTCTDGNATVHFENTGLLSGPSVTGRTTLFQMEAQGVAFEVFRYQSQSHPVLGLLCRPVAQIQGGRPVHIINHGSTDGIVYLRDVPYCMTQAQWGFVTAMSAYRGEPVEFPNDVTYPPTGRGGVELCMGEATDVLQLLDVVDATVPEANMDHVVMSGFSHGGCVTSRAVERGADVDLAFDFFGPTHWSSWHAACESGEATCLGIEQNLEALAGGPPANGQSPYDWRSPAFSDGNGGLFAGDLHDRTDTKFFILHGLSDSLVLPDQSCQLANASWGSDAPRWFLDINGQLAQPIFGWNDPTSCKDEPWSQTPAPTNAWPDRGLLLYAGAGHGVTSCMERDWLNAIESMQWPGLDGARPDWIADVQGPCGP